MKFKNLIALISISTMLACAGNKPAAYPFIAVCRAGEFCTVGNIPAGDSFFIDNRNNGEGDQAKIFDERIIFGYLVPKGDAGNQWACKNEVF